jgi:endo-1,4-beta-xylanase
MQKQQNQKMLTVASKLAPLLAPLLARLLAFGLGLIAVAAIVLSLCVPAVQTAPSHTGPAETALKDLGPKGLLIGAAINRGQSDGQDKVAVAIIEQQFNTISPENILKWGLVHPEPDRYDFEPADHYVAFGQSHGMAVIGHNLVWHQQTPAWVFAGANGKPADRETLLSRMHAHIQQVVGRYRGRIHGWDVVNEAFNDDGSMRKTPWHVGIGGDFLLKAFEFAHEADPQAELYYNDFNLWKPAKRAAALRLVKQLKEHGLRIDAVGEQGHWSLSTPSIDEIDATITDIAGAGVKAMITELDIDMLPRDPKMFGTDLSARARFKATTNIYADGLPPAQQQQLAKRYADAFGLFMKRRDMLARITFWGVTDAHSWLNDFPVPGRTNYPLLWDRQGQPKLAFDAVVDALKARAR